MMKYIALGTRHKEGMEGRVTIKEPFRIYAIKSVDGRGRGIPPFYRIEGVNGDILELRELIPGNQEYIHVLKWVGVTERSPRLNGRYGGRLLLSNNDASGVISEEDVRKLISYGSVI
jgi:hypothetical protein